MNAVEKVVVNLDSVYDVLTSLEKLGQINDLPIQAVSKGFAPDKKENIGILLKVEHLTYKFNDENNPILDDVNFTVEPGELFCICGKNGSGKSTLVNLITGLFVNYKGAIYFDSYSLKDLDKNYLHKVLGENTQYEEIFDGTVLENITLGDTNINVQEVIKSINIVGLEPYFQRLEHGLKTHISSNKNEISRSVAQRIILARAIVKSPKLLILDEMGIRIDKNEKEIIYQSIKDKLKSTTIIFISNEIETIKLCNRVGYIHQTKMNTYPSSQFLSTTNNPLL